LNVPPVQDTADEYQEHNRDTNHEPRISLGPRGDLERARKNYVIGI
jgi:hypothetical protein